MDADGLTLADGLALILADGDADGEADMLALGETLELGETLALKLADILLLILGDSDGLNTFTLLFQSASIASAQVRFKLPSLSAASETNVNKYDVFLRKIILNDGEPPALPAVLA